MATPPSHFSDSGTCTPTLAELEADRQRSGVVAAACAGSEEAADALAPPEVRQRVLSDAAAELLHDELSQAQRAALLAGCSPSAAAAEHVAGGAEAEEEPGGGGAAAGADVPLGSGPLGSGSSDPMVPLYRAARQATLRQHQLEHQGSEVTVGQPTPRGQGGATEEDEGTLGTPATPSTGALAGHGVGRC